MVFVSLVILGLLENERVLSRINDVQSNEELVTVGKLFAQIKCSADKSEENLNDLFKIGMTTYKAGDANSLRYLEVGELLSFIKNDNFQNWISQLQDLTDETFQREALTVSKMRYDSIFLSQ